MALLLLPPHREGSDTRAMHSPINRRERLDKPAPGERRHQRHPIRGSIPNELLEENASLHNFLFAQRHETDSEHFTLLCNDTKLTPEASWAVNRFRRPRWVAVRYRLGIAGLPVRLEIECARRLVGESVMCCCELVPRSCAGRPWMFEAFPP